PPADAVHVPADDVHLVRVLRANLQTNHFLALARRGRLHVDRADRRIGLRERVVVPTALAHVTEDAASARAVAWSATTVWRGDRRTSAPGTGGTRRRIVLVRDAL